jgi:hypothetical protein
MIAQSPHNVRNVLAPLPAPNVASVAAKAVIKVTGHRGMKRRGWVVEMTIRVMLVCFLSLNSCRR